MPLLLHLESIVSDFRHLFNQQNFALFQAFILGFITHTPGGSLTDLYQSSGSQRRYWSFPKFLSRGKMGRRCYRCVPDEKETPRSVP